MFFKWFPWKWMVQRAAGNYGFLDPFTLLARLRKFAEPSEVDVPLELLRAAAVFQARGIVNTRAIQHNLDWIWPYWIERQFDPRDPAFIPRSFSLTHINLTHRNWTAVNLPDDDHYALVDPRGLVTPLHDGWSIEAWIVHPDRCLVPARCREAGQTLAHRGELKIYTETAEEGFFLQAGAEMQQGRNHGPMLHLSWKGKANPQAKLCVALRPYNPEGIQFIDSIQGLKNNRPGWRVNEKADIFFCREPEGYVTSDYATGDVFHRLDHLTQETGQKCPVGMVTAAALFPFDAAGEAGIDVHIPIPKTDKKNHRKKSVLRDTACWSRLDDTVPKLEIPDRHIKNVYHCSVRTLISLSAGELYPGSYTYRRFWFRDACLMLNALLAINLDECARRAFSGSFADRQTLFGYFESQEGEWDSNGTALWVAGRCEALTDKRLKKEELEMFRKAAEWISRKRREKDGNKPRGLFPAGFSAEHLGPNNFYYWDNFWGVAGLRSIAPVFERAGEPDFAARLRAEADDFFNCITASIDSIAAERSQGAIPAAQNRRLDAGAVGSLAADYPLQLLPPGDSRIMSTVEYLLKNCMLDNAFFHDMIHSGINPYLTLHIARVLLRAGDSRYRTLVERVGTLASATGQWPEAIHPATGGGCMGDGQHGWAAAEWVLMIRSLFVQEEADKLVVGAGLFPEWLDCGQELRYGPTATAFGSVTIRVKTDQENPIVIVAGSWHHKKPEIEVKLPSTENYEVYIT
jgi:hypothetical protein